MHVNRLNTRKEFWTFVIKTAYLIAGLPFLLFIGIVMLIAVTSDRTTHRVPGDTLGTILIWLAILIPVGVFIYRTVNRRRILKKAVQMIRAPSYYFPLPEHEMYNYGDCKYLGIDIRNGTILYIHKVRAGQMDVVGMSMSDWTAKEVTGNLFKLYTKFPELPMLLIGTPWAKRWYDTLDAMTTKHYSTPLPFSEYVQDHVETLENRFNVHIPPLG